MKDKIYLDTSIPSAYYDASKPIRQLITQKWFENESKNYDLYTSNIAYQEIQELKNIEKRNNIEKLIFEYNIKLLELSEEAIILANEYINKGAIPKSEIEDSYHIAIATVNDIDALASWNFKHIVSMNPIKKIHQINLLKKYNIIEIGSLEFFGGSKYGNL